MSDAQQPLVMTSSVRSSRLMETIEPPRVTTINVTSLEPPGRFAHASRLGDVVLMQEVRQTAHSLLKFNGMLPRSSTIQWGRPREEKLVHPKTGRAYLQACLDELEILMW